MSLLKSEVKLSAVNELGCRLDDVLENATQDLYRSEGAVSALKQAVSSLENLLKILDKELNDKEVDLESCATIKSYFNRSILTMSNLASSAETNRQTQIGKIQGFQQAVQVAKKFKDEELNKLHVLQAAIQANSSEQEGVAQSSIEPSSEPQKSVPSRPVGVRPGPSIKAQRLAEQLRESQENSDNSTPVDGNEKKEELTKTKQKKKKQ